MASNLQPNELYKYSWRVEKFLEKYRRNETFSLCNGNTAQIIYNPVIEELIQTQNKKSLLGKVLNDNDGNKFSFSDLKKTIEFGGKEKGFSTRIEDGEIISLNKQLEEIKTQTLEFQIPLKISDNVYFISICSKVNGTPKADFTLSNSLGNEVVWISHKKGSKPEHFQQWGGLTEEPIKTHNETISFISTIQNEFNIVPGINYSRKINDEVIQKQSVYGIDYNKKPFGKQNVTVIIQGEIKLIKSDNYYNIDANLIHCNGENMIDGYEPVFSVSYRTDRNQFGVNNSRFFILPIKGRKISAFV